MNNTMKKEDREIIYKLASQLEAVKLGKGFANYTLLRNKGLINIKKIPFKYSSTGDETYTKFYLSSKGKQMLEACNAVLMS